MRRPKLEGGGAYGHRVFTVTQQPFDEYVNTFGTVGKVFGIGCAVFTAVGATMTLVKVARARLVRWRERRFVRRLAAAENARREAAAAAAREAARDGDGTLGTPGAVSSTSTSPSTSVEQRALAVPPTTSAAAYADDLPPNRKPGETCVVCLHEEACVCYKECGHLVCCETCAAKMNRCPLCRRKSSTVRVYRAGC